MAGTGEPVVDRQYQHSYACSSTPQQQYSVLGAHSQFNGLCQTIQCQVSSVFLPCTTITAMCFPVHTKGMKNLVDHAPSKLGIAPQRSKRLGWTWWGVPSLAVLQYLTGIPSSRETVMYIEILCLIIHYSNTIGVQSRAWYCRGSCPEKVLYHTICTSMSTILVSTCY